MCAFEANIPVTTGRGIGAGDKTVRVLQMAWLLKGKNFTVEELRRHFGVSRRTIYRDLKLIDQACLPLVSEHQGKGYRILETAGQPSFGGQRNHLM